MEEMDAAGHAHEARKHLDSSRESSSHERAMLHVAQAQVHATLALSGRGPGILIEPEMRHLVAIERALRARRGFRQTLDVVKNADHDAGFRADEDSRAPDADWGPIERECLTVFAKAVLNA